MTCVGRSKAPPVPVLPLLYEAYSMANIARSITKLLNDDAILALAHPVMASYIAALESNKTHNVRLAVNT